MPDCPRDEIIERLAADGAVIVGTPDDLIATMERYQELTGGYGGFLVRVHEWPTSWEKTRHSYELLARYVMPRFQGSLRGLEASYQDATRRLADTRATRRAVIEQAHQDYAAQAAPRG